MNRVRNDNCSFKFMMILQMLALGCSCEIVPIIIFIIITWLSWKKKKNTCVATKKEIRLRVVQTSVLEERNIYKSFQLYFNWKMRASAEKPDMPHKGLTHSEEIW